MTDSLHPALLTQATVLPPWALLRVAKNDLCTRQAFEYGFEASPRYVFLAAHVRRAKGDVARLLGIAHDNAAAVRQYGGTMKKARYLVYQSTKSLKSARKLAEKKEARRESD